MLNTSEFDCKKNIRGKIEIFEDDLIENCGTCGLDLDLCICEEVAKEEARLKVEIQRRKWGKFYTVLKGFDPKEFNLKDIAVKLKTKLACGGTVKGNTIELQGNHQHRILDLMEDIGFNPDSIDILFK